MKILSDNPYRILGVFANSSRRDIVANKGKMAAFLKVGRDVSFPLDVTGLFGDIKRTEESVNDAESRLAIAKDQVKYAQFWFLKLTPSDDVAFNHLFSGNAKQAIEIWEKQDSISSLQNRLVVYLALGDRHNVFSMAEKLYCEFGENYIKILGVSNTVVMTNIELSHQFIDTLSDDVDILILANYVSDSSWKSYINQKAVNLLIEKISSEVEKTKSVDHKDSKARINAAINLVSETKEHFSQLKSILSSTDPQFQMIADKLGLEILQCGIDYFNNSEDDEAPYTTMKMQKYAQSIVVGTLAKQRCEENVKILQKIIDDLPPKDVIAEDNAIKVELSRYTRLPDTISYAINLLNKTKPHVQSIKSKLGATNSYYLKISTLIVQNALHNVVEEVNAVQNDPMIALGLRYGRGLDSASLSRLKAVFRDAWKATSIMDGFDLEPSFKSHYNDNRNTLKSMCNQLAISTESKTENTQAGESLWDFLKSHQSSGMEAAVIMIILGVIIGYLIYCFNKNPYMIDVNEKWNYIYAGAAIGSMSLFCIIVDDKKRYDTSLFSRFGCVGAIIIIYYKIFKVIKLAIDGIKEA